VFALGATGAEAVRAHAAGGSVPDWPFCAGLAYKLSHQFSAAEWSSSRSRPPCRSGLHFFVATGVCGMEATWSGGKAGESAHWLEGKGRDLCDGLPRLSEATGEQQGRAACPALFHERAARALFPPRRRAKRRFQQIIERSEPDLPTPLPAPVPRTVAKRHLIGAGPPRAPRQAISPEVDMQPGHSN
jgi:hypothetical protein